jgi:hypothetical protein
VYMNVDTRRVIGSTRNESSHVGDGFSSREINRSSKMWLKSSAG